MKNFKTTITALVTPFKNNQIDFSSLEKIVQFQLNQGVGGFVINGTTAESPTLDWSEVAEIFSKVKSWVNPQVPLILGTGFNSTQKTIKVSQAAESLGADAVLVVVPYYNKPPQRGLIAHFESIAESIQIPVVLYNVPSRTITSLSLESIITLSKHKNIIGIKEASGDIALASAIARGCGENFLLLSGDDGTYPEFLEAGGHGVVSVASHIIPQVFADLLKDKSQAKTYKKYLHLIGLLFSEANPIPVKKTLQLMGLIESAELRLPLCELEEPSSRELVSELQKMGLM